MTTEILDDFKNLFSFDTIDKVDKNKLQALIRWISFEPLNLGITMKLNKYFFYMDKKVMLYVLHFKIHKQKQFIRTIKNQLEEDRLQFLKDTLQEYYNWSDREIKINWEVIQLFLKDNEYIKQLDNKFGFDREECKILNIDYNEPEIERLNKETTHSIEGWF